jgi:biopolymer transport protein ExbD
MVTSTRTSGPGIAEARAEINVTPLVDVCLVLLIIFMVVTPLINDAVRLPETPSPGPMAERPDQLVVVVGSDGAVAVAGRPVTADGLAEALRVEAGSGREVVIKADRAIPYGRVREVMLALSRVGISRVGLVTRRMEGAGSES